MRPFSASIRTNRNPKIIVFGSTALKIARKSLDKFILEKDKELYSRLQHRINTEYIKSKKNSDFRERNIRLNTVYNLVKEQKRLERIDTQLKNYEKVQNHSYLYYLENKRREEKIKKYKNDYRKKERKCKIIIANGLFKKIQNNKGYPKDFIIQRINEIKRKRALREKELKNKLSQKEQYLNIFKEMKDKNNEKRRMELDNILKIRSYRIIRLNSEETKQREELRKEIEKRNMEIDKFIYEKEKINEQKRNIYDFYDKKYEKYSDRIDNILYKKDLDKDAINQIKLMSCEESALIGLGQNLS